MEAQNSMAYKSPKVNIGTPLMIKQKILDWAGTLAPIIFTVIFFTKIVFACTCASGSMEPTLNVGSTTFYNRLAYIRNDIERGDIIAFRSDEFGEIFAKRVIGLPGDTITFQDGYVVVNGQIADESDYLNEDIETNCQGAFTVPEGTVFVLGDNRENSYDSRFWENPYIPIGKIKGKFIGSVPVSVRKNIEEPLLRLLSL